MKRTYRSKRDVAGALDHKDILNLNDKGSVFDAFYIQNLKQTKRELSYVSSNQYVVASKNLHKKKYTKRIVNNANAMSKDSPAPSAYLTPDKSMRVNKAFDPFDALLNSSLNIQADVESNENNLFKNVQPKREHKLYNRQTKTKNPKIINYSNSDTDSGKENSGELSDVSHNKTDIRKHKLLVEREAKINNRLADESINNIVLKIPGLSNIKQNVVNDSFRKFSLTRVTLTDNIQSPILQHTPLSSTPFKKNYSSQSIYKFSPILKSHDSSSNVSAITGKSIIHNNSEIHIEGNKETEPELHKPIKHSSNDSANLRETSFSSLSNVQGNSKAHIFHLDKDENKENDNLMKYIQVNSSTEVSSLHTTDNEPFLGFSKHFNNHFINAIKANDGKGILQNANELCVYDSKGPEISQNSIHFVDEDINNDETIMQKSKGKTEANIINSRSQDRILLNISLAEEKENYCRHLERQTLFNTSNNNESLQKVNKSVFREPIVILERINDSIFFRNYKKRMDISQNDKNSSNLTDKDINEFKISQTKTTTSQDHSIESESEKCSINQANKSCDISQNDENSNNLKEEDSNEFKSFQNKTTTSEDYSIESISEASSTNDATKSSIMENDDISSSDEQIKSANEEERYINFVTTRKRTKTNSHSIISDFEYKSYSGSMELDQIICNNLPDNKTIFFNVSKVNTEDFININSNDEISTLLNNREKRMSLKENSNTEITISTNSDETNYYDNDSTDDTSMMYTMASNNRLSFKNYSQCAIRKRTRKRSSRISRIRRVIKSKSISESAGRHNNSKNGDDTIEIISSDSASEKLSSVYPRNNRSLLLSEMNKVDSNKVVEINSTSTDENNKVSLYAFPPNVLDSDDTDTSQSRVNTSCIITKKSKRVTSKYTKVSDKIGNVGQINAQINNNKETLNSKQETVQATFSNELIENDCDSINSIKCITNKGSTILSLESINVSRKTVLNENQATSSIVVADIKPSIVLEPGKKWERSLSIYRRMTMMAEKLNQSILDEPMQMKGRKYRQSVISTMEMQDFKGSLHNESINSRRSTFISKPNRSTIKFMKDPNITRVSLYTTALYDDLKGFLSDDCDDTIVELSKLSVADAEPDVSVLEVQNTSKRLATARDYVLRRCNQTDAILFDECYPETVLKNCHKIGEGVYGEVFLWRDRDGRAQVMKIVPIAGHVKVNGECQKDFHEIISEIVIAMELSALRTPIADIEHHIDEGKNIDVLDLHTIENATDVFNEVLAVRCVYGNYPSRLLDLWDLYDECKGSENDNPAILPVDQQYLVLELANAGLDLESYQFNNAEQAHALFLQVAFGLAVGEEAYQFEHRDLHWGNVLISPTDQKFATFVLRGRGHRVPRCGVSATIIDYSLSRISLPLGTPTDCAALYNDLATDDGLFDAVGDYQFEVYRLMRDKLGNDWKNFEPYTNILWLHYVVDKMITALRYKRTNTKIHKHYIDKLKSIKNRILDYKSAVEFVLTDNEF